ncbi:glycosyltransferase family 4 protein [Hazenella coriacea]|uniref:Glycosyltransferase involved in cell wall biosynthesis n=1 Tax=Hazenella coriacea TaxID=1179467 RepID=A0A4R3L7I0_9BACL|nr:glycosyltransferase family 4 protein [Hazenella coriacea]TCS95629.1 glycosyltransferase involved in cell wall biosynthesis [Hazenella coriacea]
MQPSVMIFSSVHPYDDSRIFHKQAVSLAKAGYRVELHAVAPFEYQKLDGVEVKGVQKASNRRSRLRLGWVLFQRALKSNADLFHFHDPELLPWGVLLAWRTGRPVIYDSHEDLPKQILTKPWIPQKWRKPFSRLVNQIEKRSAQYCSAVIAATESIYQQFAEAKRREIIKNYPLWMPMSHSKEDGVNRILYIGGISYLRGYKEMIQMMDYIPKGLEAELHLIGPLQHISDIDLDQNELEKKRVYLHGRIPFAEVKDWLMKGKVGLVCLHPIENYRESLPIKMFEYMAAGMPFIATDFPLWRQIVERSKAGFVVDSLNPEEMAEYVTLLLSDSSLRKEMGSQGRWAHEQIYNWSMEEKKLLSLYRLLLSEHECSFH